MTREGLNLIGKNCGVVGVFDCQYNNSCYGTVHVNSVTNP